MNWDDQVPNDINIEWYKIKTDVHNIEKCKIPRWIFSYKNDKIELHGFCDASMEAYACVVYARCKNNNNITLIAGKSKLTPHKKIVTLPRLELCGAYLLSKLINKIKQSMNINFETYGWCDSMVVLGWLQSDTNRWRPFVANRVASILNIMPASCWHYIKSGDNPADCASRGITTTQLVDHSLWWQGPLWLPDYSPEKETRPKIYLTEEEAKNIKQVTTIQKHNDNNIIDFLLEKHNSFIKITRILAWIFRTLTPISKRKHLPSYITLGEIRNAKLAIMKYIQSTEFALDINILRKNGRVNLKSQLVHLNPFIDKEGILRVGGRLKNANISYNIKHPAIISHKGRLAELLIDEAHRLTFHGGPKLTLATLRQQYWITSGTNATKKQLRKCVICRKNSENKEKQIMADLPTFRSNPAPPFYHTGVDYTGFIDIKINKGRGVKTMKGYVAVFVCMVTKAVHFELVSDLTSSAFLAALKRMTARRGAPRHLYSDQGTNFIGANRLMMEEYEKLQELFSDNFLTEVTELNIEWHFNAPSWPSAGGLWERSVGSLKFHLKRVIGQQKLTFEELATILAQLEACLNSRPLCSLTENIEDLEYLSPAHFLTGRAGLTVIETKEDGRTRWHLTNEIFKEIWKKWKLEYLTQLSARAKWFRSRKNMRVGDLVIIHDENIPAGKWPMGRVIELHPGSDGNVRVVSLKTKNGIIKRPISKLSLLPIDTSESKENSNEQTRNTQQGFHNKRTKQSITFKHNFISLAITMLTFFMTIISTSVGSYYVTNLENNHFLYFDKINNMQVIRDDWRLVVYYDLQPYWEGSTVCMKYLKYLNNICLKIKEQSNCEGIMLQLNHGLSDIEYYNKLLLNQHFSEHLRRRRGLINGIGSIANSLFGVLDDEFAKKYERDISLIKENEDHLAQLWKNQTSVVEAEFNFIKRMEEIMKKQHKSISKQLSSLENSMQLFKTEILNITFVNDFTMTALITNNIIFHLKSIQDTILDTITNIYNDKLNLHLLTPAQLQTELQTIATQLPRDLALPVNEWNSPTIYHLLKVKTRITKTYIIFEIRIPLITRDAYEIFKLIPIPRQIKHDMIFIKPITELIAISVQKDSFLKLTETEFNSCLKDTETLLCNTKSVQYHLKNDEDLCQTEPNNTKCIVFKQPCQSSWIKTSHYNTYLYFCCDECHIKLICTDQISTLKLTKAGLLFLNQSCVIKAKEYSIYTNKQKESTLKVRPNLSMEYMAPINHIFKPSIPKTTKGGNFTYPEHQQELLSIQKDLEKLKKEPILNKSVSYHDVHHYVLIYVIFVLLCIATTTYIVRRVRRRWAVVAGSAVAHQQPAARCITTNTELPPTSRARELPSASDSEVKLQFKVDKACTPIQTKQSRA